METPNYNSGLRGKRLSALRRAMERATDPEFKEMWRIKMETLAEYYDVIGGVKYEHGYTYHPNK